MGKGGRLMKGMRSGSSGSSGNGIMGSGVSGLFGSVVTCKNGDNSFYCNFIKFFNF